MTPPYRLVLTARVRRDIQKTFHWLHQRSPEGAVSWRSSAYHALISTELNPFACSLAPESDYSSLEIRNQFFHTRKGNTYRFVFFVVGHSVIVTHLRNPGQRNVNKRDLP
jgi:plasmid stabilization system protein ParE